MSGEGLNLKGHDNMAAEEELVKDGWKKKATYDDPRLTEMVALYEKIGFEVHLEPINTENINGCTDCMQQNPDRFKTIYTRMISGKP
jgi:hypothetical protein